MLFDLVDIQWITQLNSIGYGGGRDGVQEFTRRANELQVSEYQTMEIYSFLVMDYLVLVLLFSFLTRKLEKRKRQSMQGNHSGSHSD